jgi:HK97 family phage major capsid protein
MTITPAPTRAEELREKARAKTDEARTIAETAETAGRDFTPSERSKVKALLGEAKTLKAQADEAGADAELRRALGSFQVGDPMRAGKAENGWGRAMRAHLSAVGAKSGITPSGSIQVPSISAGLAIIPDRLRSVLNLIPFVPEGGELFSYLREVTKDHQASTVATGKLKPRSTYELEKIDDRVRTIAHVSDPIARNLLADVELVEAYVGGVLREGAELELERQVLVGAGSTAGVLDDLTGILGTSGRQSQAWSTDIFTTTRKAVTKLENLNLDPTGFAFVMTPTAWEGIELQKDDQEFVLNGRAAGSSDAIPLDRSARRLWGIKVVPTTAMADAGDGVAILGDFGGSAVVHEREGVVVEWSEAPQVDLGESGGATASAFEINARVFRGELRAGLEINRPAAFVEIDIAA